MPQLGIGEHRNAGPVAPLPEADPSRAQQAAQQKRAKGDSDMSESRCFIHKNGFSVAVDCSTLPPEDDQPQTFTLLIKRWRIPKIAVSETAVTLVLDRDMLDALNDADDLAKLYRKDGDER